MQGYIIASFLIGYRAYSVALGLSLGWCARGALSRDTLPIQNQPCLCPGLPLYPSTSLCTLHFLTRPQATVPSRCDLRRACGCIILQ